MHSFMSSISSNKCIKILIENQIIVCRCSYAYLSVWLILYYISAPPDITRVLSVVIPALMRHLRVKLVMLEVPASSAGRNARTFRCRRLCFVGTTCIVSSLCGELSFVVASLTCKSHFPGQFTQAEPERPAQALVGCRPRSPGAGVVSRKRRPTAYQAGLKRCLRAVPRHHHRGLQRKSPSYCRRPVARCAVNGRGSALALCTYAPGTSRSPSARNSGAYSLS